ncbi:MAG: hypothetical protein AMXMBFR33_67880 [Candidatus Xenobia bacterium]
MRKLIGLVVILSLLWGCSGSDLATGDGLPVTPLPIPAPANSALVVTTSPTGDRGLGASALVPAASGGRMALPDGAFLDFPPGALGADTTITVTIPDNQGPDSRQLVYLLEPNGLTFNQPVTLTVPVQRVNGQDPRVQFYESSQLNPIEDLGSERTNWRDAIVIGVDEQAGTVSLALSHFTVIYGVYAVDELSYLVMDIPEKFLLPGDLLFTLTADAIVPGQDTRWSRWRPGHVAMYGGKAIPGGDSRALVESTSVEGTTVGVRTDRLDLFRVFPGHIYMGPRRPAGALSASEREAVLKFALDQLGRDYSATGDGAITQGREFSCVGLMEAAYQSIGKPNLTGFQRGTVSTPLELFRVTKPVDEITIDCGETVSIPVYGVQVDRSSPTVALTLRGYYSVNTRVYPTHNPYNLVAEILPPRAKFVPAERSRVGGHVFTWTPNPEVGGKTFKARFRLTSDIHGNAISVGTFVVSPVIGLLDLALNGSDGLLGLVNLTQDLTIHVRPCPQFVLETDSGGFLYGRSMGPDGALGDKVGNLQVGGGLGLATVPAHLGGAATVYTSNQSGGILVATNVGEDGTLTSSPGSPYSTGGAAPGPVAVSPSGSLVAVLNNTSARIFQRDPATGSLTPGAPFAVPGSLGTISLVGLSSGEYLCAARDAFSVYQLGADGTPTAVQGSPFALGMGNGGTPTPDGRFFYGLTNNNGGQVIAVSLDPATGVPTPVTGSPFTVGSGPRFATVHPNGRFLYVLRPDFTFTGGDVLVPLAIAADGSLSPLGSPVAVGSLPLQAAVTPDGSFLYVANAGSNSTSAFRIDPDTGLLNPVPAQPFPEVGSPLTVGTIMP